MTGPKEIFSGSFSEEAFISGWEQGFPREQLKPVFGKGEGEINVEGNGNPYIFGYWKLNVDVEGGKTYKFKVKFKSNGIDDINLHVLNLINWRIKGRRPEECPHDQISYYYDDGEYIIGEQTFETAREVSGAEIQLGLRYVKSGRVSWREASLIEAEREKSRIMNVTAVKWNSLVCGTAEENLLQINKLLDQAGLLKSDLILLPEFSNYYSGKIKCEDVAEAIPEGEICRLLGKKAREYNMNVCAGVVERDGDFLFNAAILFDRQGKFLGKYRKVHLYWPEAIFYGESPGDEHPVFDLDIGRVGIITCYDSWYPESARILGLKGAELILFPNAGYEPLLIPARAIDNGVYFVVSSLNVEAMIVDTRGQVLAQSRDGIISTKIDLSRKPMLHPNSGGSLNSAPGGRRGVRNSMSNRLYDEISDEVRTWKNRYVNHTGL